MITADALVADLRNSLLETTPVRVLYRTWKLGQSIEIDWRVEALGRAVALLELGTLWRAVAPGSAPQFVGSLDPAFITEFLPRARIGAPDQLLVEAFAARVAGYQGVFPASLARVERMLGAAPRAEHFHSLATMAIELGGGWALPTDGFLRQVSEPHEDWAGSPIEGLAGFLVVCERLHQDLTGIQDHPVAQVLAWSVFGHLFASERSPLRLALSVCEQTASERWQPPRRITELEDLCSDRWATALADIYEGRSSEGRSDHLVSAPGPLMTLSIGPVAVGDRDRLSRALIDVSDRDPLLQVHVDPESHSAVLFGPKPSLELALEILTRELDLAVRATEPEAAYRQGIRKRAEGVQARVVHRAGGRDQFGHVVINIEPGEPGSGFVFEDAIKGGVIPRKYRSSVEAGLLEAARAGVLAGYPIVDVRVELVDGSYDDADSSDSAFRLAGSQALTEGVMSAQPITLEPVMEVEVVVPSDYVGDVIGDLSSRRARVREMTVVDDKAVIGATVPVGEMGGYRDALNTMADGQGIHRTRFAGYEAWEQPPEKAVRRQHSE